MKRYMTQRADHIASAVPGIDAAAALSDMTDEAVRELARAASSSVSGRWAVVALGGWGAGALLPDSDLDILVLCDSARGDVRRFSEALFYPLWDAGLRVGHQVRTPRQQRKAMREDLKSLTASLSGRPIAGDAEWAEGVLAHCVKAESRRARARMRQMAERPRPGSPFLLDADLKAGAGGRRDYDELRWTAGLLDAETGRGPESLLRHGLLQPPELSSCTRAAATIAAARWSLPRVGAGDRMTADGPLDADTQQAVQAALVDQALVLDCVRRRTAGEAVRMQPLSAAELLLGLDGGSGTLESLWRDAALGLLDVLVPGMQELMALRRPGLGHELTVGAHCIKAAALVTDIAGDPGLLGKSSEGADRTVVQVAALVHDIGKVTAGAGHAGRGAHVARTIAARILDAGRAATVSDLVRLHLLLPQTATSADLDDEDSILACAAEVRDRRLLSPLHVLSAADSMATGPSGWTVWRAALVGTLVSRLDVALSPEVDGAGIVRAAHAARSEALAATGKSDAERSFVEHAPLRYLAAHTPAEIAAHAQLVGDLLARHGSHALMAVSGGPAPDTHRVTIVAPERPELLARLAGAVSLAGLDILAVDAYRGPGGTTLEAFVVAPATGRPTSAETFSFLERLVNSALQDRLGLEVRLEERRGHYPPRRIGPVSVRTESSGWDTALHVTAPDRPGLLHDIAKAVSDNGLQISWARAQTIEGTAKDVFHIIGPDGGAVLETGLLGHVCARIREVA